MTPSLSTSGKAVDEGGDRWDIPAMRLTSRVVLAFVLVGLLASALVGVGASSSPASPNATVSAVVRELSHPVGSVGRFWTQERMSNAKPLPLLRLGNDEEEETRLGGSESVAGVPFSADGGLPEANSASRSVDRIPEKLASSSAQPTGWSAYAAGAEPIFNPEAYPYSTHGKIFFTRGGRELVCSATIVPSDIGDVVWTAGHCLTLEGVWASRVQFVPGYDYGNAPYGEWEAEWVGVHPQWARSNDPGYDYGYVVLAPNAQGQSIADVVGWRGIVFNQPRAQTYHAFGYPAGPPYDGEGAWVCSSAHLGDDPYYSGSGPSPMGIDCDMTGGSSGGGWIVGNPSSEGWVNSVNSYSKGVFPGVMFGPYLDSQAQSLWQDVATTATPTPQPTPTESVDTHEMVLSFVLRKHLIARGTMSAPDGYAACTRAAPVGIFKKTSFGWKLRKVTQTNDFSTYRVRLRDRAGRYVAYSLDGYVDDLNYCTDAISIVRVHRH